MTDVKKDGKDFSSSAVAEKTGAGTKKSYGAGSSTVSNKISTSTKSTDLKDVYVIRMVTTQVSAPI
jgi:hypothetical protein